MGKGIELARELAPEHAEIMEDFRDQLIIALIRKYADKDGELKISVNEIDQTGQVNLLMSVDSEKRVFNFKIQKKN